MANEPNLLTNNPMVDQFYDNTQSNVIRITDDKLKVILMENKEGLIKSNDFLAPLILLISLVLTFCTTDFKDFLTISASVWKALYLFLTMGACIWLFLELKKRKKNISIDELITKIRNQKIPSVIIGQGGIIIYSATYLWNNGQVDITGRIKDLVSKGILHGVVDPGVFGIDDPIYGTPKTLKLHYRINGQEKELSKVDGETFRIE